MTHLYAVCANAPLATWLMDFSSSTKNPGKDLCHALSVHCCSQAVLVNEADIFPSLILPCCLQHSITGIQWALLFPLLLNLHITSSSSALYLIGHKQVAPAKQVSQVELPGTATLTPKTFTPWSHVTPARSKIKYMLHQAHYILQSYA